MVRDSTVDGVSESEPLLDVMRTAAESGSLLFVHGLPQMKAEWSWDGKAGNETEFISIGARANAGLVYFDIETFDLESIIFQQIIGSDLVSDFEDDYEDAVSPIVQKVLSEFQHWVKRDGQSTVMTLMFIANGVCHQFAQSSNWFDRFQEEISQHIDGLEEALRIEAEIQTRDTDATKKVQAEELARSDRYARAKNDVQRRYVAEDMFPDATPGYIVGLLELSALLYWDKVEPERETDLAHKVGALSADGLNLTQIVAQLGITKDRANRLLAMAQAALPNNHHIARLSWAGAELAQKSGSIPSS